MFVQSVFLVHRVIFHNWICVLSSWSYSKASMNQHLLFLYLLFPSIVQIVCPVQSMIFTIFRELNFSVFLLVSILCGPIALAIGLAFMTLCAYNCSHLLFPNIVQIFCPVQLMIFTIFRELNFSVFLLVSILCGPIVLAIGLAFMTLCAYNCSHLLFPNIVQIFCPVQLMIFTIFRELNFSVFLLISILCGPIGLAFTTLCTYNCSCLLFPNIVQIVCPVQLMIFTIFRELNFSVFLLISILCGPELVQHLWLLVPIIVATCCFHVLFRLPV